VTPPAIYPGAETGPACINRDDKDSRPAAPSIPKRSALPSCATSVGKSLKAIKINAPPYI